MDDSIRKIEICRDQLLAGPDIVSRGFVYMKEAEDLMDEAQEEARFAIEDNLQGRSSDWNRIKNAVRDALGDFFWRRTKRRPMILPMIMEVED